MYVISSLKHSAWLIDIEMQNYGHYWRLELAPHAWIWPLVDWDTVTAWVPAMEEARLGSLWMMRQKYLFGMSNQIHKESLYMVMTSSQLLGKVKIVLMLVSEVSI